MSANPIMEAVELENRPHMPDPAVQQEYAEKHGDRSTHGWKELTDIQVASRARMLMRSDWTHESVCTATRDRICALVLEKQALVEALERLNEATNPLLDISDLDLHRARVAAQSLLAKVKGEA